MPPRRPIPSMTQSNAQKRVIKDLAANKIAARPPRPLPPPVVHPNRHPPGPRKILVVEDSTRVLRPRGVETVPAVPKPRPATASGRNARSARVASPPPPAAATSRAASSPTTTSASTRTRSSSAGARTPRSALSSTSNTSLCSFRQRPRARSTTTSDASTRSARRSLSPDWMREEESMGERSKQTASSEGAVGSMRDIEQFSKYVDENIGHLDKFTISAGLAILAGRAPTLSNTEILGVHGAGVLLKNAVLIDYASKALTLMENECAPDKQESSGSSGIGKAPVSKIRPPTATLKSIDSRKKSVVAGASAARGGGTQVQNVALSDDDDDDCLLSALDNYNVSGSAKKSSSSPGRSRPSQLSRAPHSAAKATPFSRAPPPLNLSPIVADDPINDDAKKKVADGGGAVSPARKPVTRRVVTPSRTAPKRAASAGRGAEKQF